MAAIYSLAVTASQVISTRIPLTVLQTNVIRTAAVGLVCASVLTFAKEAPNVLEIPHWVTALSVLSGVVVFFAAVAYTTMCRKFGVVATAITTTAFGFLFTTIAGIVMGEKVRAKTYVAMAAVLLAIVIEKHS